MLPFLLERALLPLRQVRARARGTFVREEALGAPVPVDGFAAHFPQGDAAYNGIGPGLRGDVLFAIGARGLESGARLFAFDPATSSVRTVADLDRSLSATPVRALPQGKVHVDLLPIDGRVYAATHLGYYERRDGVERPGTARGYAPYPGGWFFAVQPSPDGTNERVVPLAQAPAGEGLIAMSADAARGRLHALTWPHGRLLSLDLRSLALRDHGPVLGKGEAGSQRRGDWVRICRSLAVDPATGAVFWSDAGGRILRMEGDAVVAVSTTPRREMWRKVVWHPGDRVFYGIVWQSGSIFRFDPASFSCEEIARVPATSPATLAFALDPGQGAIHLLAAGPGLLRDRDVPLAGTVLYMTCDLSSGAVRPHGPLRLADGRFVTQAQSLYLADAAYSVCGVELASRDRSQEAMAIRASRRRSPEYRRSCAYVEEMMLARFALAR